jgi:transposase
VETPAERGRPQVVGHGISSDVLLLGLDGFRVLAVVEDGGELFVGVETTAAVVGCAGCGTRARSKGRRVVQLRDLAVAGRPVRLVWRKRRWRCVDPDCEVGSWSETHPEAKPRACLTERARRDARDRVGRDGATVVGVARELGVSWDTVMRTVRELGAPLLAGLSLEGTTALGMDEHRWRHRPQGWATGFCDLETGRLLEVVPGRSSAGVRSYLALQPAAVRGAVGVVALDPWRGYLGPVRDLLPRAEVVVDHFHLVRLANQVVTEVRQRTQQEVCGHRGRKGDPLFGVRHLLLRGRERLTSRQRQRLTAALDHPRGDRWDEIGCAWTAKELLRDVYAADGEAEARSRLHGFYRWAEQIGVPEVERLARTVASWESELLAYHTGRLSNAKTEAVNLLIEKVRRVGHGYRNWRNYRLRPLLHCGVKWHTPPTAKIRGRRPPIAA